MSAAFLSSQSISLHGLSKADLPAYQSWISNPAATEFMESGWRPASEADVQSIYEASTGPSDTAVFTIVPNELGRAVGVAGLYLIHWICRRAEFRILIGDDDYRGRGYGTEAARLIVDYGFGKLNLETIYLGVNAENAGAVKSYEKAGFQKEGIRRKLVYRNARYYDVLMMSILREEWVSSRNGAKAE